MAFLKEVFQQQGLSAADFLKAAVVPTYTPSPTPVYVTYQTLRSVAARIDPATAKQKIDAVAAVVAQADPIGHALLLGPGVDVNFADAQQMLNALPSATNGLITVADCDAIRDLGRSKTFQWQIWGLEREPVQQDIDNLPAADTLQAQKDYFSGLTTYAYAILNDAEVAIAKSRPVPPMSSNDEIRAAYEKSIA